MCKRCRYLPICIQTAPQKLAQALHGQKISSENAVESWKMCSMKSTLLSHCSFVCTKACFLPSIGSLIPCFCCWGGNEGAAGNSGNWIFYYYFRNTALVEKPRAVLYSSWAESQLGSWTESYKREILQCLQWEVKAGQSTVRTRPVLTDFSQEFERVADAMSVSNSSWLSIPEVKYWELSILQLSLNAVYLTALVPFKHPKYGCSFMASHINSVLNF